MSCPMSISNIKAGWLIFGLGDSMFAISYLSDFKAEMDYVLDLDKENNNKAVILDMESDGSLCVQTLLDYDTLFITIFPMYDDRIRPFTYRYIYNKFLFDYVTLIEGIKNTYINDFIMDEDVDYIWDSEDYKDLKLKIMKEQ